MKRTNVTFDHINKWSKRKPENMVDETQWAVLIRSRPMRSRVAILDKSFSVFVEARCSSAFFLGHVVYLCLSSSSDDHPLLHSCLGTGMRFGTQNKFCHYRASLVHSASSHRLLLLLVCWWEQYHDTATDYSDLRNRHNFSPMCVGKHVTVSRY